MNALLNLLSTEPTKYENFLKALEIMGKGMLGIFIVIAILVVGIVVLNKVTAPKNKPSADEENEN